MLVSVEFALFVSIATPGMPAACTKTSCGSSTLDASLECLGTDIVVLDVVDITGRGSGMPAMMGRDSGMAAILRKFSRLADILSKVYELAAIS